MVFLLWVGGVGGEIAATHLSSNSLAVQQHTAQHSSLQGYHEGYKGVSRR